jgi:hypothetical protein
MFDDYEKEKTAYTQTFASHHNYDPDAKPWLEYQERGPKKIDSMAPDAPMGMYMEKTIPEPLKDATGRSEWYGVRNGGTKMKRLIKNNVLTERGVSMIRMLPDDKEKYLAAMERRRTGESAPPPKKIQGTFHAYDPPRYGLGKALEDLGDKVMTTTLRDLEEMLEEEKYRG